MSKVRYGRVLVGVVWLLVQRYSGRGQSCKANESTGRRERDWDGERNASYSKEGGVVVCLGCRVQNWCE